MRVTRQSPDAGTGFDRFGHAAVAVVLVVAFLTGGGASDRGIGDVATQLLALPLLGWALVSLCVAPGSGLRRAAVAMALLIPAILALQQLPVSEALWRSVAVRDALAVDVQAAGVGASRHVWALSPLAAERGLWSVLPALAVFLGTLALPLRWHRPLLLLVVALGAASMVLGFLQLGLPQDSILNPFPDLLPMFGGVFAHFNHQATMLGVCVVIITAVLVDDARRDDPTALPRWARFGLIVLAVFLFASLPLTTSRAMGALTVLGLVAVPLLLRRGRHAPGASAGTSPWVSRATTAVLGLVGLAAIAAAVGWLRFDIAEEVRWSAAKATAVLAQAHSPLGAGVGSFVGWFDQAAPDALTQQPYYQNHAHNEYAQWWFESGVLGVLALAAAVALLLVGYPARPGPRSGRGDHGIAVAAWLGCMLMLMQSWVDYPLRTPALMTVAGLLAGIVVAQRIARGPRRERKPSAASIRSPAMPSPSTPSPSTASPAA